MKWDGATLYVQRADGMFRPIGEVRDLEIDMQLTFVGTVTSSDGSMTICVKEGNAWDKSVTRSSGGDFACTNQPCIWSKHQTSCEHVRFARELYETVIAPTKQRLDEEKVRKAKEELAKARAIVDSLEKEIPGPESTAFLSDGGRRILLDES